MYGLGSCSVVYMSDGILSCVWISLMCNHTDSLWKWQRKNPICFPARCCYCLGIFLIKLLNVKQERWGCIQSKIKMMVNVLSHPVVINIWNLINLELELTFCNFTTMGLYLTVISSGDREIRSKHYRVAKSNFQFLIYSISNIKMKGFKNLNLLLIVWWFKKYGWLNIISLMLLCYFDFIW